MNAKFWPSLEDIAKVRIAKGILYSCNLHTAAVRGDINIECPPEMLSKIKTIFRTFSIPSQIEETIFGIVPSLSLEIWKWHFSHKRILFNTNNNYYNSICWYSHGIINRFGTAKILVQDETISITARFILACMYYLENQALTLWENLSVGDRLYTEYLYISAASIQFWIKKFRTGDTTDALQMFHGTTGINHFHQNYLGLRHYFKELGRKAKYRCLSYGIREGEIHHFDLYLCFAEMNNREAEDLFTHLSESNRLRVMELFLYWPLQSTLVKMLCQSWSFISQYNFRNILHFIVRERIGKGWPDVDYPQLIKDIWRNCPVLYRNTLKRDPIYAEIKLIVAIGDSSTTSSLLRHAERLYRGIRERQHEF